MYSTAIGAESNFRWTFDNVTVAQVGLCLYVQMICMLWVVLSVRIYIMTLPVGVAVWCKIIGLLVENEWGRMWLEVEGLRKITKLRVFRGLFELQTRDIWNAGQTSYTWSHVAWNNTLEIIISIVLQAFSTPFTSLCIGSVTTCLKHIQHSQ